MLKTIPQQLYCPEQVRKHEAHAAQSAGVSLWELMERAGAALFTCFTTYYPKVERVAVLCGKGNNGGDGYIFASLAAARGYQVQVFAAGEPKSEHAQRACEQWLNTGGEINSLEDWFESSAELVIDALLGTGISKPLAGVIRDVVEELNQRDIAVIAADIPTGLHGDKGCALGVAVRAHHTVTMVALKRGLFTGEAARYCGQVEYADLGVMREFRMQTGADAWRLDSEQLTKWLGPRDKIAHKGESGHVLVIGGAQGMAGAAGMCGLAALRAGAGKVSVICGAGQEGLAALTPEMMVRSGSVDDSALLSLLEHADVIALGPGLGQSEWAQQWWQRAIDTEKPLIVDADGLNLLAQLPVERDNWILTPHPAEAARLLACDTARIQADRWAAAKNLHAEYGGTIVLKGAGTLINAGATPYVCAHGTPAMATAGMGDILTGIIAGLYAQSGSLSLQQEEVACAGVLVHALAAENAAGKKTRGIIATDLMEQLASLVNPEH
ncbi:MAG: ADP-dependent NAD(P)H-hydrate dehydratase [Idiomarinaceae bacterium HL-53]|nr:MAG: ADP-dependent NAD(P)H-hydrate dehydratase [Idiomarinaceae bacterium HL-53]CUS47527.1 NAD(P)H-hydrate epimerase [Idiomarinaceae bacterium HL-53]